MKPIVQHQYSSIHLFFWITLLSLLFSIFPPFSPPRTRLGCKLSTLTTIATITCTNNNLVSAITPVFSTTIDNNDNNNNNNNDNYDNDNEYQQHQHPPLNPPYSFDGFDSGFFAPIILTDDTPSSPTHFYLMFFEGAPYYPKRSNTPETSVLKVKLSSFLVEQRWSVVHPQFAFASSKRYDCRIMTLKSSSSSSSSPSPSPSPPLDTTTDTLATAAKRIMCANADVVYSFKLDSTDTRFDLWTLRVPSNNSSHREEGHDGDDGDDATYFLTMDHDGEYAYVVADSFAGSVYIYRMHLETGTVVNQALLPTSLVKSNDLYPMRLVCAKFADGTHSDHLLLFVSDVETRELRLYRISKSNLQLVMIAATPDQQQDQYSVSLETTNILARSQVLQLNNEYYIVHMSGFMDIRDIYSSVYMTRLVLDEPSMQVSMLNHSKIWSDIKFGYASFHYTPFVLTQQPIPNTIGLAAACPESVILMAQFDRYNLSSVNTIVNGTSSLRSSSLVQYLLMVNESLFFSATDEQVVRAENSKGFLTRSLSVDRITKPGVLTHSKIWQRRDSAGNIQFASIIFGTFEGEIIMVITSYQYPLYRVIAAADSINYGKVASFDIDDSTDTLYVVFGTYKSKLRKYNLLTMEFDKEFDNQNQFKGGYPENLVFMGNRVIVTTKDSTIVLNRNGLLVEEKVMTEMKTYKGLAVSVSDEILVYATEFGIYEMKIPQSTNFPRIARKIEPEKAFVLFKSSDNHFVYFASETVVKRLNVRSFSVSPVIDVSRYCHPSVRKIAGCLYGDDNHAYIACQSRVTDYDNLLLVDLKTGFVLNSTFVDLLIYRMQNMDFFGKLLLVSNYGQVQEVYPLDPGEQQQPRTKKMDRALIISVASIGGVLLCALIIIAPVSLLIIIRCWRRSRRGWKHLEEDNEQNNLEISTTSNDISQCTHNEETISKRILLESSNETTGVNFVDHSQKLQKLALLKIPQIPFSRIEVRHEIDYGSCVGIYDGTFVHVKRIQNRITDSFVSNLNRIALGINHPNLTKIIGYTLNDQNDFFVVSEREDAVSLYDWLYSEEYEHDPRQFSHKLTILTEVCRTLIFLNQQQPPVCHNNLRAQTILIVEDDLSVKLINWCSCFKASESARKIAYVAPEVLKHPNSFSMKSDVYSFGVLMWELFFMTRPYTPLPALGNDAGSSNNQQCLAGRPTNLFTLGMQVMSGMRPEIPDLADTASLYTWFHRYHRCSSTSQEVIAESSLRNYFSVMQRCWDEDPEKRPTLEQLWTVVDAKFHDSL